MSNLNNLEPQQVEPEKRVQNEKKKQNRRPELQNHTKDPPIAPLFFDTVRLATFFEIFWIAPKGLPFFCFDILQHSGCQKIPKSPPFTFFGTVTLFKKSHFRKFLKISHDRYYFDAFAHAGAPLGVEWLCKILWKSYGQFLRNFKFSSKGREKKNDTNG